MLSLTIFGYLAAALTTISFVPQTYKTLRFGHTEGLSAYMYTILCLGFGCWLIYGLIVDDLPMILANSITLPLALTVLVVKLRKDGFN